MKRLVCSGIVLFALPTAGSAAMETAAVKTVATTKAPITRFAQDGGWLAWTTEKSCAERISLRSLRTGRQITRPLRSNASCSSSRLDALAVAGGRAIWTTLYGAGNTERDFAVGTMSASDPHPRTVRKMAMVVPEFGPDPLPPPVAARGKLAVYYRHEDGILARPTHDLELVVGGRAQRAFTIDNPVALAVDRGRIATVQQSVDTHYAVWTPSGGAQSEGSVAGTPLAVALDGDYLAILTQLAPGAKAIAVVRVADATVLRTVAVPASTASFVSASGGRAIYAAGRSLYALTLGTGATAQIATAVGQISGLAVSGPRVSWAENSGARGRVRTLTLQP